MNRFWPRRLGAQIALLVALALAVAQAVNFTLLYQANNRQIYAQTSTLAIARLAESIQRSRAGVVGPVNGAIESPASPILPSMDRQAAVAARAREMLAEVGIEVGAIDAAYVPAREFRVRVDALGRMLRQDALEKRIVIVISAQVASSRWVSAAAPLPANGGSVVGWLIFQTLVIYGFVLLTVIWIGGRLARPLAELRGAAERFTSAETPQPIEEQGPDDIRELIAAFNGMRTRIVAMLDEKDRMLGAIGHDLRTPLASLRVRTELVDDDAERARMAETIDDMNRTIDDILSLARLGRSSESIARVDLAALVDSVIEDFRDLGAEVTFEEGARVAVAMRPNLIKRAVRNLIENALKYGLRADVRVVARDGAALVEIDDAGPGIPLHEIERMFEPFTRLDSSRSRGTGGAGLGLALARGIAAAHGGALTLANRPEGGLRATLSLPLG